MKGLALDFSEQLSIQHLLEAKHYLSYIYSQQMGIYLAQPIEHTYLLLHLNLE
jgi:hypothetical protein